LWKSRTTLLHSFLQWTGKIKVNYFFLPLFSFYSFEASDTWISFYYSQSKREFKNLHIVFFEVQILRCHFIFFLINVIPIPIRFQSISKFLSISVSRSLKNYQKAICVQRWKSFFVLFHPSLLWIHKRLSIYVAVTIFFDLWGQASGKEEKEREKAWQLFILEDLPRKKNFWNCLKILGR
jgi:hypothetical protein